MVYCTQVERAGGNIRGAYMKQSFFSTDSKIKPYIYKTLKGRFVHLPAARKDAKRTFVVLYGQHATLERIMPIMEALTEYGDVYGVDNPGFGGMDSSYRIKEYPSLDFYAGHLKYFIDTHIPAERQLTLLGISFGFQIVTKTLALYPELNKRTETAMSFVGFVHHQDFSMPLSYSVPLLYFMANGGRFWLGSKIAELCLKEPIIVGVYQLTKPIQVKFRSLPKEEAKRYAREQAWLWRVNDARTHAATAWDFFKKNDLTGHTIDATVIHVGVPNDHLFDNSRISAELKQIYNKVELYDMELENHAPLDVETPDKVHSLMPDTLKVVLRRSRNRTAVTA